MNSCIQKYFELQVFICILTPAFLAGVFSFSEMFSHAGELSVGY
jgi:hypothetical protein